MVNFTGQESDDRINGSAGVDRLLGSSGNDTIQGLGGNDRLEGGSGADVISGGQGNDIIYGLGPRPLGPASGQITATLVGNIGNGAVQIIGGPPSSGRLFALNKDTGVVTEFANESGVYRQVAVHNVPAAEFSIGGERGVLSIVLHPDYATNGRLFALMTAASGDVVIREYADGGDDGAYTLVRDIISIPHRDFTNHNGGTLLFGPDGMLYASIGDGGGGNDPGNNAQNVDSLLGKVLRLDVNGDDFAGDPTRNYAIPDGNPFVGQAGADEIWALGLRNPWRMSFDPVTGKLYIADVGQGAQEEVNVVPIGSPGLNYGWDYREGTVEGPSGNPTTPLEFIDPAYVYGRDVGQSITGGHVYRYFNSDIQGHYFFADFVSGRVFSMRSPDGVRWEVTERTAQIVGMELSQISSFGTDDQGRLYIVKLTGEIYLLTPGSTLDETGDILSGGAGNDFIFGDAGNDRLNGDDGNDGLTGGTGADRLDGGAGQDTASYKTSLTAVNVNLFARTASGGDAAGDTLVNVENLVGSGFNDVLAGNGLANVLNGLGGADIMFGGTGNDIYHVDNARDVVREVNGPGGGTDRIVSTISFNLSNTTQVGGRVENLSLAGSADIDATGDEFANVLTGNSGDNDLNGMGGNDTMRGGAGNDRYVVGQGSDIVIEAAGQGVDTIISSFSLSLAASQVIGSIENLRLSGAQSINGYGNALSNRIIGNSASNLIDGSLGRDILEGGGGRDVFRFSTALSTSNADFVLDFQSGTDRIALENFVMPALGSATRLVSAAFHASATGLARDASDRIIYETDTGNLFYDADGVGTAGRLLIARLIGAPALTSGDFIIV